jgi:ABC-type branched-subunit amino acid transport system substrate-binding protein
MEEKIVQMNEPRWNDKQLRPCPEWEDMLVSEELLSPDERRKLAAHIEQCSGCRQTQWQYRVVDKLARRFFGAEPPPAEAPLLPPVQDTAFPFPLQDDTAPLLVPGQAAQVETPTQLAIDTLSSRSPRLPDLRRGTRPAWNQPTQIISALPSLLISSVTGLLIFAFSQFSITFWHMSPPQALPLAMIGTAIILWPILERLQFRSTVQPKFRLAGQFPPAQEQDAAFRPPDRTERPRSGKEQGKEQLASKQYILTPASQHASLNGQTRMAPLMPPRRRRLPVPHMAVLLLVAIGIALYAVARLNPQPSSSNNSMVNSIGQPYGLSIDGNRIFDLDRPDASFKLQTARAIAAGDNSSAEQLLRQGILIDSNDAEALIYQEDLNVLASHHPYITVVVATTMDHGHTGGGRDLLQGAYLVQKEVNNNALLANGVQLRLLIASVGFNNASAREVAQQIVQQAQKDHTIVGVMGFPTSASTLDALPILAQAHIPLVAAVDSSNELTNKSPYFFRVIPSDTQQGAVAARYAKQILHARHVAVFEDPQDAYSHSLAEAFTQNFVDAGHSVTTINYTREQPQTLPHSVQQIQNLHADLLYFSGYVNDATVLLKYLPACDAETGNCLQVMGGDAFYVQGDYSLATFNSYSRLIFTAFASPDTWKIQGLPEPAFFNEYTATFDPRQLHQPGTYGYNLPDADTMLAYDAMQTLERAISLAQAQTQNTTDITPAIIQQSLNQITGNQSVQGVSGTISFHNGEVTGKPVLVLQGGPNGQTSIDSIAYP